MKRLGVGAAVVALVTVTLPLWATAAGAQEGAVTLTLIEQTPFATPDRPMRIQVGAVNGSETRYGDLELSVGVYSAARSRSELAQALETGPVTPLEVRPPIPVKGQLDPGGAGRSFKPIELEMEALTGEGENALYPVTVELRSAGTPIAVLRTVLVFIFERPLVPLNLSLSFILEEPVRVRPDGALLDDTLERSINLGGRLATIVGALEEDPVAVTLAVSPVLLELLQRMGGGYQVLEPGGVREVPADDPAAARAVAFLERLRALAQLPTTEIVALPYASPSAPSLVAAGLDEELDAQIARGTEVTAQILGVEPSSTVFRPPGSALSNDAVEALVERNVGALLVDAEVLPPAPGLTFSPPAVAEIHAGEETAIAIAADGGVDARIAGAPSDPLLAAQWLLGELSAIYFELPSDPRGVAVVFAENDSPDAVFLRQLLRGLTALPSVRWLRAVSASRLLFGQEDQPLERRDLPEQRLAALSPAYSAELARAREAIEQLASMAEQPELLDGYRRMILQSESRHYLGRQDLGIDLLQAVREGVRGEFAKVQPPEASSITLTSRRGDIPVTLHNEAGYPVRVALTLQSARLQFLGGGTREILLDRPVQVFLFPVRAQTTGRFPVGVEIRTPAGALVGDSQILVRSTAYNRIALVITIGAALFLAVWWGRRFLPRRRA